MVVRASSLVEVSVGAKISSLSITRRTVLLIISAYLFSSLSMITKTGEITP